MSCAEAELNGSINCVTGVPLRVHRRYRAGFLLPETKQSCTETNSGTAVNVFALSISAQIAMMGCGAGSAFADAVSLQVFPRREPSFLNKIAFTTDDLPAEFDDRARLSEWRDFLRGLFGPLDVSCPPDHPFSQNLEAAQFGTAILARFAGTADRFTSTSSGAATMRPDFYLGLKAGPAPTSFSQRGRDVIVDTTTVVLGSCNESVDLRLGDHHTFLQVALPQARLEDLIAGAQDLVARPLDSGTPAMRHLRRYLVLLAESSAPGDDPDLIAHIETTLIDLVALALGAGRETAEIAGMRGLRAARLQDILSHIRADFSNPGFSPDDIARRLGVTPRYVQTLLQEAGSSFTERVLELRLQRARSMLSDWRCDRMKIGEIAQACGFSEISYFNRCFRRRFGLTPTGTRGGSGA